MNQISCIFMKNYYYRFEMMDYGRFTTLNRRNQGFTGSGGWLDFLFFENVIYIFLRDSLLNVFFCLLFSFLKILLCGVLRREKQNEGHSQRSNCRKHHNHVLSSYHYWRCMWLRLSVCEWVFVRIHQGVIWNYFWQRRSISIAIFFGTEKKRKKKITLFHFGSSAPPPCLPPIAYLVWINLCSSGSDILLFIYSCCSV